MVGLPSQSSTPATGKVHAADSGGSKGNARLAAAGREKCERDDQRITSADMTAEVGGVVGMGEDGKKDVEA